MSVETKAQSPRLLVERLPLVTYMVAFGRPSPVAYVSPQFERLFGWTHEECLSRTDFWESKIHPDDRPRFLAAFARVRETHEALTVEYRVTTRAGAEVWVRDVGEVGPGEDGELYVHGYLTDITREKELERELADERAQAEAFFRDSPAGLGITDAEGRYLRVNEALARINGATADAHIGRTLDEVAPAIAAVVKPLLGRVQSTGESLDQREYEIDRADGQRRQLVGSMFPIEGGGATHYGRIVIDVTEQRRAEEKGAEAERQYRRLIEQLPLVMYVDALAPEARNTFMSPQIEALFGYPAQMFIDDYTLWYRIIHPDDREHVVSAEEAARERGEPFELEYRVVRPDGDVVWVLDLMETLYDGGKPVSQQGFLIDVTERRENERLFRAVFDNADAAMVIVDDDARNVDVNPAAWALFGRSREELLGKRIGDLSAELAEAGGVWEGVLAAGAAEGSFTVVQPSGAVREAEYAARANVLPGRHLAVLRDVTDRKNLELELWRAQRLESVGRLAGGVAHDFNNLLTAIRGYALLLLARSPDSTVEQHHAQEIVSAADRAAALTAQLLAFGRRQVLQPRAVDLNRLVSELSGVLSQLAGAEVGLELDPSLCAVRVDPEQIEQVLVNLVANAAQAAPGGGILIHTANADLAHDQVRDLPAGRYAVLSVQDFGPGLDEATLEHLFEPFFTTRDVGQGVGLGLATAYGIARQSGGTIEVTSEPGAGATFSVFLPEESAADAEDAASSAGGDAGVGLRKPYTPTELHRAVRHRLDVT